MTLRLDWETRSDRDLIEEGVYRYVESPFTDALMCSYKIGKDGPLRRWRIGQPCPEDIRAYVEETDGEIEAHNAAFERLVWWHVMSARHGWPKPALERFRCTAVAAAAMSLPRDLKNLADALGLAVRKNSTGRALIRFFSLPVRDGLGRIVRHADGRPVFNEPDDHPERFAEFQAYCDDDVLVEELASQRLVPLSDAEQQIYHLNERINDRGLRIDRTSALAAVQIAEKTKEHLTAEITAVTGGYVTAVTQVAALLRWVKDQGVELETLDKDTVDEVLHEHPNLPDRVRRALELRQVGAKPSVEKIAGMLRRCSADGRLRGAYLHHGAGQTGRFSSRGAQTHNMPKYRKVFEDLLEKDQLRMDTLFAAIRTADPNALIEQFGPEVGQPLHLLSDAVRSFIWAAPGYRMVDADYTSIEGVVGAWMADEQWKLDAFKAAFAGTGPGIYELAAAGIYGIPVEAVSRKVHRPTGKVAELSCMYQTGVGGISKFARGSKIKLADLYPALWDAVTLETQEAADKRFEERRKAHDRLTSVLGREGWIAAELIKMGWRQKHPATVAAWKALQEAVFAAVADPGSVHGVLKVRFTVRMGFLWMQLPSGRCLAYGNPKIEETEAPWADKTLPEKERERQTGVTAMGVDSVTGRWQRFSLYGGALFNNCVQGTAADLLRAGMLSAEAAGLPVVLHTHDEICCEVPADQADPKLLERIICQRPDWAADIPIVSDGWAAKRYRK